MAIFKNDKLQNIYNFLNKGIDGLWEFEWENWAAKAFIKLVNALEKEDWIYFEQNIELWDSENLAEFAHYLLSVDEYLRANYYYLTRCYCLAFIHCNKEESNDLSTNLPAYIGLLPNIAPHILVKVIDRLKQHIANNGQKDTHIERSVEFVKEKLENTLNNKDVLKQLKEHTIYID